MYRMGSETSALSLGTVPYLCIFVRYSASNISDMQSIYHAIYKWVYGVYSKSGYIVILHQVQKCASVTKCPWLEISTDTAGTQGGG